MLHEYPKQILQKVNLLSYF